MVARPEYPLIVMNPRAGDGKVARFDLRRKAEQLGAKVVLLGDRAVDLTALLHEAVDDGADLLGVASGDGTLGLVAGVAVSRDVPLLVIPAGTRNHFALDLGLDRLHPDKALEALTDGRELVIDLGVVGGRTFVNNVSLGAYAEVVQSPDYRDNKLRVSLEALPDALSGREQPHFTVRGGTMQLTDPTVALISNNPYGSRSIADVARRRLDGGLLGLIGVQLLPAADVARLVREKRLQAPATSTTAVEVAIDAPSGTVPAAIDGESVRLETPVRCQIRPRCLRVRVPQERSETVRGGLPRIPRPPR